MAEDEIVTEGNAEPTEGEKEQIELAAQKKVDDAAAEEMGQVAPPATGKPVKETNAEGLIDRANTAADRLEAANVESKKLLDRADEEKTEVILSGKTEAGAGKKEETPKEYKDRIMRGDDGEKP